MHACMHARAANFEWTASHESSCLSMCRTDLLGICFAFPPSLLPHAVAACGCCCCQAVKGLPFMKGHSSAGMAGAFARTCNVQHLLLTHFSQRYVGAAATPAATIAATAPHVEQASQAAGHQRVYAAQDLQVFHVAAHIAPQESFHDSSTRTQARPRARGSTDDLF